MFIDKCVLSNLMQLIWYNPELDLYQKGTKGEYKNVIKNGYKVIYEFTNTSDRIVDRVVDSLNILRMNRYPN